MHGMDPASSLGVAATCYPKKSPGTCGEARKYFGLTVYRCTYFACFAQPIFLHTCACDGVSNIEKPC